MDRTDSRTLTSQLCSRVRELILTGKLLAEQKLPSSREAAEELGISRNLVTEVYEQLIAEGFLSARQGSGTYVEALSLDTTARPFPKATKPVITHSVPVIDFAGASGTPDLESFPFNRWKACVRQAMDSSSANRWGFGPAQGEIRLREVLVHFLLRTKGISCSADQIFVTSGIHEAFHLLALFFRNKVPQAVIENPGVVFFKRIFRQLNYHLSAVDVDEAGLIVEQLAEFSRPFLSVVSPSHQYPVGSLMSIERRLALLERMKRCRGYVFEDDYDGETRLNGLPVPPLFNLCPSRVFYAGSFNKTLFPAVRSGFLVVPQEFVRPLALFRSALSIWPDQLNQATVALFIEQGFYERRIRTLQKIYTTRRTLIESLCQSLFGQEASISGSPTGAHCRMDFQAKTGLSSLWRSGEQFGIKATPLSDFYLGEHRRTNEILMGYGNLNCEQLTTGMERLLRLWKSHGGNTLAGNHPT